MITTEKDVLPLNLALAVDFFDHKIGNKLGTQRIVGVAVRSLLHDYLYNGDENWNSARSVVNRLLMCEKLGYPDTSWLMNHNRSIGCTYMKDNQNLNLIIKALKYLDVDFKVEKDS